MTCHRLLTAFATLLASTAFAQTPGKELPPPPIPSGTAPITAPVSGARQSLGALSESAIPAELLAQPAPRAVTKARADAPLERLDDAPQLPPMSLAERAQAPKTAPADARAGDALVTTEDVREGDIRTGVRVMPRNAPAYTLTDPRQDGIYKLSSEGSPLSGKVAVPKWQVFRW